jgi:hypothetical protein
MNVLVRLDAVMRDDLTNRGLRPTAALLLGRGQINLSTSLGPLDPLCGARPSDNLPSRSSLFFRRYRSHSRSRSSTTSMVSMPKRRTEINMARTEMTGGFAGPT